MHFDLYIDDLYIVDIYIVGSLAKVQKSALVINISIGSMSICDGFKLSRKIFLMPNQGFDNSYFEGFFYSYTSPSPFLYTYTQTDYHRKIFTFEN